MNNHAPDDQIVLSGTEDDRIVLSGTEAGGPSIKPENNGLDNADKNDPDGDDRSGKEAGSPAPQPIEKTFLEVGNLGVETESHATYSDGIKVFAGKYDGRLVSVKMTHLKDDDDDDDECLEICLDSDKHRDLCPWQTLGLVDTAVYGVPSSSLTRRQVLEQYQVYTDSVLGTQGNGRPNVRDLVKPLLNIFHSENGNSLWKRRADAAFKECKTVGSLLEESLKAIPDSVLDSPISESPEWRR
ncbi:hypothetical protein F2Q70_00045247 [Brassica cretica]|uniref:Uncharacterized protein n=1 Tax=Brassica cretica TaxID=69181 RepID=A0A8S9KDA6_BRACR|nr:hypothetical protein F2Q70_00045247 [Brassica cretica]